MKSTILLFLLIVVVSSRSIAQEASLGNFKHSSTGIVYEKVFKAQGSRDDLATLLNPYLPTITGATDVRENAGVFSGKLSKITVDSEKYGVKSGDMAATFSNYTLNGNFTVEVKDNKYRVVVQNLTVKDNDSNQEQNFTEILYNPKKRQYKSLSKPLKNSISVFDQYFTEAFTIKNTEW